MVSAARRRGHATAADLLSLPEQVRAEIVAGVIVEKAAPSFEHGDAQSSLAAALKDPFQRGRGGPGGWWIATEVEIELETHEVYRPDLAGWRRERVRERPRGRPIRVRADWVCEILSTSNAEVDLGTKLFSYHRAGIPHYWIVDPDHETVTIYRWNREGYLVAASAGRGERIRAEPFDAIELETDLLFGEIVLP
jgi:Uma2 family endonuclease